MAVAADRRQWSWGDDRECPHENDEMLLFPGNTTPYIPRVLGLSAFGGSAVLSATAGTVQSAAVYTYIYIYIYIPIYAIYEGIYIHKYSIHVHVHKHIDIYVYMYVHVYI